MRALLVSPRPMRVPRTEPVVSAMTVTVANAGLGASPQARCKQNRRSPEARRERLRPP